MNRSEDFEFRLRQVDWASYETAYGPAVNVARNLLIFGFGDEEAALTASHNLWCSLCHQHVYISTAALPALPFLLEILEFTSESVALEIMDIFLGFVRCTHPGDGLNDSPWGNELRTQVLAAEIQLQRFTASENAELVDMTQGVMAYLRNPTLISDQLGID